MDTLLLFIDSWNTSEDMALIVYVISWENPFQTIKQLEVCMGCQAIVYDCSIRKKWTCIAKEYCIVVSNAIKYATEKKPHTHSYTYLALDVWILPEYCP